MAVDRLGKGFSLFFSWGTPHSDRNLKWELKWSHLAEEDTDLLWTLSNQTTLPRDTTWHPNGISAHLLLLYRARFLLQGAVTVQASYPHSWLVSLSALTLSQGPPALTHPLFSSPSVFQLNLWKPLHDALLSSASPLPTPSPSGHHPHQWGQGHREVPLLSV